MKESVIAFLKDLTGTGYVEINNLNKLLTFNDARGKDNIYFCAWLPTRPRARCKDQDFIHKKYIFVDIDIRENHYRKTQEVLNDDQLTDEIQKVMNILQQNKLDDYSYAVFSWNGLHLYYVGEEIEVDYKTYSAGVRWLYQLINDKIQPLGYSCDPACHNIARISRLPWTINTRHKIKDWKEWWKLEPVQCELFVMQEKTSQHFTNLKEYAKLRTEQESRARETKSELRKLQATYKKDDSIFDAINAIPVQDIAEIARWVTMRETGEDVCSLVEPHKNMWAYVYKPFNIVVAKGSSLIKSNRETFTPRQLALDEIFNGDKKRTVQFFKDKYNLEEKVKWSIKEKKYEKVWYVYGNSTFDPLDCMMSGELVWVVAQTNSWKTTFAMNMLQANKSIGKKWFYINLEFEIAQVAQKRWLEFNNKTKKNMTDLDPLTENEKRSMEKYIKDYLSRFEYYNEPNWLELDELIELIVQKNNEWYWLFVIDTFSRIKWNLQDNARWNQNICMEKLQELCQKTWVCIVLCHHTNKAWVFEGSQKIMDLSNVFITIERDYDPIGYSQTTFKLSKDKFITNTEIKAIFQQWEYLPS